MASISPQLSALVLCAVFLSIKYLLPENDPYGLRTIPAMRRSRFLDAYRSGVWWRVFLPRLQPYLQAAYEEYSRKGKPFKIFIAAFNNWVYILPPKHLHRIRTASNTQISLRDFIDQYINPDFEGQQFDGFERLVTGKLLNTNLVAMIPRMHTLTGAVLDSEMGRLTEWKGFNAGDLTAKTIFEVSGPIVFGENLVKDTRFINIMHDLAKKMVIYAFLLRWFNIPVVGGYLIHAYLWTHRRNLATAAQCIEEEIARREQLQHSADDCVQWVMDPDIPSHMRKPDRIVKCLINLGAGMIDAPGRMLVNLLYDLAAHPECVNEIRAEIFEHAGADGWNADSIAKMKKFDSFIHESSRLHPLTSPLTGWRMVTSKCVKFDDDLVLPSGTTFAFATMCIQRDPEVFADPDKFDGLRFYKLQQENDKGKVIENSLSGDNGWIGFGHGRQACPGRFFAVRLLKTVIAEIIMRYDLRFSAGIQTRPESLDWEPICPPDTSLILEFRSREEQRQQ